MYAKCDKCKAYGWVSDRVAQLYSEGMLCNCGGHVEVRWLKEVQ